MKATNLILVLSACSNLSLLYPAPEAAAAPAAPPAASVRKPLNTADRLTAAEAREANALTELCKQGKLKEAAPRLRLLAEKHPNVLSIQLNMAQLMLILGESQTALSAAGRAIKLDPTNAHAWRHFSEANMHLGKQEEAVQAMKKAVAFCQSPALKKDLQETLTAMNKEKARNGAVKSKVYAPGSYIDEESLSMMPRWSKERMPLAVFISPGNVKGYNDQLKELLKEAFADWEKKSGTISFKFTDEAASADITCLWVEEGKRGLSIEVGHAIQKVSGDEIMHATVELETKDANHNQDVELKNVMLHEIGHAIGIRNHSQSAKDIMYFQESSSRELSEADLATLKALYESKSKLTMDFDGQILPPTPELKQALNLIREANESMKDLPTAIEKSRKAIELAPQVYVFRKNFCFYAYQLNKEGKLPAGQAIELAREAVEKSKTLPQKYKQVQISSQKMLDYLLQFYKN